MKGCPGPVHHRIASGALGWINSNSPPSGFWKSHSAIIHRTVWCATGLSGVPPDCPVCQRSNDFQAQWSTSTVG
jgi:hypothetical protein